MFRRFWPHLRYLVEWLWAFVDGLAQRTEPFTKVWQFFLVIGVIFFGAIHMCTRSPSPADNQLVEQSETDIRHAFTIENARLASGNSIEALGRGSRSAEALSLKGKPWFVRDYPTESIPVIFTDTTRWFVILYSDFSSTCLPPQSKSSDVQFWDFQLSYRLADVPSPVAEKRLPVSCPPKVGEGK
jgi:hypothetical protein